MKAFLFHLSQTACGDACVDIQADGQNCGACARSCNSGFVCSGAGCVLPTGNPYLGAITPPSSGTSSSVTLTFSGDGFQVDPGRSPAGCDNVRLEDSRLWLGRLPEAENGFAAGTVPGENAVDTKVNAAATRARLVVRNVEAWGFRGGLISNMAAFNLKEKVEATLDGVTVHDSEIALKPGEILLILAVLLLLFGATRLPQLGSSLGSAIRNFTKGFTGEGAPEQPATGGEKSALSEASTTESAGAKASTRES